MSGYDAFARTLASAIVSADTEDVLSTPALREKFIANAIEQILESNHQNTKSVMDESSLPGILARVAHTLADATVNPTPELPPENLSDEDLARVYTAHTYQDWESLDEARRESVRKTSQDMLDRATYQVILMDNAFEDHQIDVRGTWAAWERHHARHLLYAAFNDPRFTPKNTTELVGEYEAAFERLDTLRAQHAALLRVVRVAPDFTELTEQITHVGVCAGALIDMAGNRRLALAMSWIAKKEAALLGAQITAAESLARQARTEAAIPVFDLYDQAVSWRARARAEVLDAALLTPLDTKRLDEALGLLATHENNASAPFGHE